MLHRWLLGTSTSIFIATFGLTGCGTSTPPGGGDTGIQDSGPKPDAKVTDVGFPTPDTGMTVPDTGMATPDTGMQAPDTGAGGNDAMATDSSTTSVDAGGTDAMPTDSSTTSVDGGGMDAMAADSSTTSVDGGGVDGTSGPDSAADAGPGDAGPTDSGTPDVGPPDAGCVDNTACMIGATNGVCKSGSCVACTDMTDDALCTTAYGGGTTGYLCISGNCVRGNCRTDSNCNGQICGVTTPNTCGACTSDTQCQSDPGYGSTFACNTIGGTCVPNVCAPSPAICTFSPVTNGSNPSDYCCPQLGGGLSCRAGNCCTTADCAVGMSCTGGTCTNCTAATNATYYVNPLTGSDSGSTGSMSCPFRTITHAVSFLGNNLTTDATVIVLGTTNIGALETFPITLPQHVHVRGDMNQPPTVQVPMNASGFQLSAPNSSISNVTIDGQMMAQFGILAVTGSSLSTSLDHVTVENTLNSAISVRNTAGQRNGGRLTINAGVVAQNAGTTTTRRSGLEVTDNGHAEIVGVFNPAMADMIQFINNRDHGIIVTAGGSVTVTATAASVGVAPSVIANFNDFAGLWIQQTVGNNPPPLNRVWGLTVFNNGTVNNGANGVHLFAGSNLRLRRAYVLNNRGNGIFVQRTQLAMNMFYDDVSLIDLGDDNNFGHNTVQATFGQQNNARAGICLEVGNNANQTLHAAGNIFSGPRDCSQPSPGAISRTNGGCPATGPDIGVSNGSSIDTSFCTQM